MLQSIITRKGQTTIPKKIREFLNLKPNDKLYYIVEDMKVVLKPIHGDILQLKGSVPPKEQPADFEKSHLYSVERFSDLAKIAKKIAEED